MYLYVLYNELMLYINERKPPLLLTSLLYVTITKESCLNITGIQVDDFINNASASHCVISEIRAALKGGK